MSIGKLSIPFQNLRCTSCIGQDAEELHDPALYSRGFLSARHEKLGELKVEVDIDRIYRKLEKSGVYTIEAEFQIRCPQCRVLSVRTEQLASFHLSAFTSLAVCANCGAKGQLLGSEFEIQQFDESTDTIRAKGTFRCPNCDSRRSNVLVRIVIQVLGLVRSVLEASSNEKSLTFQELLESQIVNLEDEESIISLSLKDKSKGENMITLLFMAADPTNASRLRLGEEAREIQQKLQLAKLRDNFALHQRMSVRPEDFSQALLDVDPQIVHFSGHGTSDGNLCFEDKLGNIHPVSPEALAALFEQFSASIKCVVLNACYSDIQARAIANHIEYVIGMSQAIGDKAAIAFAIGFYQALGAGRSIEDAYRLGCVQIGLQGIPEHLIPVLLKRVE
jgi:DNA-directed RNA polymerase subunit RPC12/RpoP